MDTSKFNRYEDEPVYDLAGQNDDMISQFGGQMNDISSVNNLNMNDISSFIQSKSRFVLGNGNTDRSDFGTSLMDGSSVVTAQIQFT